MSATLLSEDRGPLRLLTLNRPERRNALSGELVEALLAAVQEAAPPGGPRALVLTGAGDRFCAGGDLGPAGLMGDGFLAQHAQRARFADLLHALVHSPVPIVAAVQGDAMGGGFGLAAACHLIVVDTAAGFSTPELKLGLFPMMIWPVLARALPQKLLNELVLTSRRLGAEEALRVGLVNEVAPEGQALERALALANRVAERSRAVVGLGLRAAALTAELPLPAALAHMSGQLSLNLTADDAAEGVSAFLGRRAPEWKDR
jgi:enoyl-CoA hydratase/carnithine racemase